MNEIDKLIEEQFKKLPLNLQSAIKLVPWKTLVSEVGKANALDSEQIASLEQETMLIIYGFEDPNDFIDSISREVGVENSIATTIANDIAEKILNQITEKTKTGIGTTPVANKFENITDKLPEIAPEILPEVPPENLPSVLSTQNSEYGIKNDEYRIRNNE